MKKYIILLIPLVLLSSCTIDWNNEKDKKIINPENNIQDIQEKRINCENTNIACLLSEKCIEDSTDIDLGSSTYILSNIAKIGTSLFYFQNIDTYPSGTDLTKNEQKKGYIYVFKEYDCLTHKETELVGTDTMLKTLNNLPPSITAYAPDIFGFDVFFGKNWSYFDGILRFDYIAMGPGEMGIPIGEYHITINNNKSIYIQGSSRGIDSSIEPVKFSTGIYLSN